MNKKPLLAAAVVLAAAAAFAAWYFERPALDPDRIVLYGNVDQRQVSLAFNGSDRIHALAVQEGDRVKAGQTLGRLNTRALELQIAQARADIAAQQQALNRLKAGSRPEEVQQARARVGAARADAQVAQQQLDRLLAARDTTAGRAVSQLDLDNAQARRKVTLAQQEDARKALQLAEIGPRREDIAQQQALVDSTIAALALLEYRLGEAELKAPVDAVVRSRLLEPGDMASPQRPVYALAITSPKWVRAYVNETDLGRVRPGMAASVTIDSDPGRPLSGQVGYISSVAEFTPKTVQTEELRTSLVYEIRVLTEDPDDRLRLGMPATVALAAAGKS